MVERIRAVWPTDPGGMTKASRVGGVYFAVVPAEVAGSLRVRFA